MINESEMLVRYSVRMCVFICFNEMHNSGIPFVPLFRNPRRGGTSIQAKGHFQTANARCNYVLFVCDIFERG